MEFSLLTQHIPSHVNLVTPPKFHQFFRPVIQQFILLNTHLPIVTSYSFEVAHGEVCGY